MKKLLLKIDAVALCAILAIVLATMSVAIERTGPEMRSYGNLCGPASNADCYKPAFKGGFPFAFLIDTPGISVEYQLAFIEDDFYPGAFCLDVAVYFSIAVLVMLAVSPREPA